MIRTSKNKLRTVIAGEYIRMLSESRNLSEEQIQELGKWWKQRQAKKGLGAQAQSPKRVDVGGGAEVLDPEMADFEQQLGGASWASDDIESLYPPETPQSAKTQTQMRTMDINKGEKRPYAKKVGLAEAQLRSLISDMVKKNLAEAHNKEDYEEYYDEKPNPSVGTWGDQMGDVSQSTPNRVDGGASLRNFDPIDLRKKILNLAHKSGMSPQEYLQSLGFEDEDYPSKLADKDSLWAM